MPTPYVLPAGTYTDIVCPSLPTLITLPKSFAVSVIAPTTLRIVAPAFATDTELVSWYDSTGCNDRYLQSQVQQSPVIPVIPAGQGIRNFNNGL